MTAAMTAVVLVRDEGDLRRITLNRPEKINALDTAMLLALTEAVEGAPRAGAVMVAIDGAGPRGFCAGGDVAEMGRGAEAFAAQEEALRAAMQALHGSAVPVVSVVHGRTLGAGCIVACLSDLVLGADSVQFGFPEMRFGLYPAFVHAALTERLPAALAFQICAGGRMLSAAEAYGFGFLTEILPAEGFAGAVEARVAHYRERVDALVIGRRILRMEDRPSMAEKTRRLAPLLAENHAAPSVRRLLAGLSFAR
ncbi:enoyl-CoA hydratase/isomerase family protein [Azospirillum doebereinerae]|uniref:enoyl-CoA hydratase/isomerase family protein n=1 Tax=Azospirillum doebereinerae TaxID=92933 RepID=UPI001EE589D7|nr:enoyl-CoA hydratase/isomerase family protein [Azospirillum doebereinerae]MCG5238805.1 enoyl-CoA hydratase/isomerase family protein [Azospirillum doebereinerae]